MEYLAMVIYLDHNASAPLAPEVARLLAATVEQLSMAPGNAASVHQRGRRARARLDDARARLAQALGCDAREVCFTSSGSESDALALKGAFDARVDRRRRTIVTSQIEHPALLGSLLQLEASGAKVVRVPPMASGQVDVQAMIAALSPDTALCSLMWANNETGVLQPVAEVARACRERGIVFHSDAVQAAGKVPLSFREQGLDLLSLSGHKLGAPPGVGALVIRRGLELASLVPGHQENGRRGGTPNVAYAEALALALELSLRNLSSTTARIQTLRTLLETQVSARVEGVTINGGRAPRLSNTSNLCFSGADGEALLIALDLQGICVSTGAACASGSLSPSHVLTAMGLSSAQANASLRLSLGPSTTEEEINQVVDVLVRQVPKARELTGS